MIEMSQTDEQIIEQHRYHVLFWVKELLNDNLYTYGSRRQYYYEYAWLLK